MKSAFSSRNPSHVGKLQWNWAALFRVPENAAFCKINQTDRVHETERTIFSARIASTDCVRSTVLIMIFSVPATEPNKTRQGQCIICVRPESGQITCWPDSDQSIWEFFPVLQKISSKNRAPEKNVLMSVRRAVGLLCFSRSPFGLIVHVKRFQ